MDVSAHGKVDEDKDVELDEDGEGEEDGVQDEAGQAQPPVQSPFVQMDTENLQTGRRGSVTSQQQSEQGRIGWHRQRTTRGGGDCNHSLC